MITEWSRRMSSVKGGCRILGRFGFNHCQMAGIIKNSECKNCFALQNNQV